VHNFDEHYQELNKQQKQAVDQIEGPVMVVAGPGTGKTQLLSVRVANILQKTDTQPQNILCLTFTNKAATNMRQRLIKIIGPEARHVNVKTFHSFATEIMNQYPDSFWNGAKLSTVPDSVQIDIIQTILKSLPLDNPLALKFAGKFTTTKPVQDALKLAKEAGLSPDMLRALIEANIAYIDAVEPEMVRILDTTLSAAKLPDIHAQLQALPKQPIKRQSTVMLPLDEVVLRSFEEAMTQDEGSGKSSHVSKWKSRWIKSVDGQKQMADERKRNDWWLALADVYRQYREQLHERGFYDYADMLVEVISKLSTEEQLRADVQEQFLYLLIDEFQDTNPAQMRLAHLIATHESNEERPNLMVVGDDDQSIFKFNGAELNNLLNFRHDYKIDKPIVLEDNYRSTQAVLDTSQAVISQAQQRLVTREHDITKQLVAQADLPDGELAHKQYENQEHQFYALSREIAKRRQENPDEQIAVLARGHNTLRGLAARLAHQNVPILYEQQQNILDHPAVMQILHILELVVAIQNADRHASSSLLSKTLQHPMWGLDTRQLWQLAIDNKSRPDWLDSMLGGKGLTRKIADWLVWLSRFGDTMPLSVVLEHVIGLRSSDDYTSPFRDYYLSNRDVSNLYIQTLTAVQKLRHIGDEFGISSTTLSELVRLVQVARDNNIVITNEQPFLTGPNPVELLTVHKAKGMEFDTVYLADAMEDTWKPHSGGRKPPANLPLKPYGDDDDDYVRLMFVALTRAKSSIIACSYTHDETGAEVLPTPLLHEVLPKQSVPLGSGDVIQLLEEAVRWPSLDTATEKQLLLPVMEKFQLSVTGLLNFLDVTDGGPQNFKLRNVLHLPEAKSIHMSYGTAAHAALEFAQHQVNTGKFSLAETTKHLKKALQNEQVPAEEYERYARKGQAMLKQLFEDYKYTLPQGALAERSFSRVLVDGAYLGGKLDRIDERDDRYLVVDYKTGKPLKSFDKTTKTTEVKVWKHKLQLIFYAMLMQESGQFKDKPITGQMVYVEADKPELLTLEYTPTEADITELKKLIAAVWQNLQKANFPDTAEYDTDLSGIKDFIKALTN
jgi:DNA helicase-2/ATP-dependent DNA helicase PcrA